MGRGMAVGLNMHGGGPVGTVGADGGGCGAASGGDDGGPEGTGEDSAVSPGHPSVAGAGSDGFLLSGAESSSRGPTAGSGDSSRLMAS